MVRSRLKILFCVTISISLLLAPFALDVFPDGNAFGMGKRGSDNDDAPPIQPSSTSWTKYKTQNEKGDSGANHQGSPVPVPEPTTLLLVGAGLGGLAILRKKFKK